MIAWLWLEQALCWQKLREQPNSDFYQGKRQLFSTSIGGAPRTEQWLQVLNPIDTTCLDTRPEWF